MLTDDDARDTLKQINKQDEFPWLVWVGLLFCAACWWGIGRLW